MAKLKVKGGFIEDDASIEGLFSCTMKYEIKNTSAMIDWTGPKIPLEVWHEILAFFQWCYDEHRSECQVRLYCSPTLGTWKAWAYPQEAKTGMTAREINNEARQQQNAQFQPPDWVAMGTVHHHCAASAFQSGTDREDEKDVTGLHITIGNMNSKDKYDIHARFYRRGLCLNNDNIDLSWFFQTENLVNQVPEFARQYLPKNLPDKQARVIATRIPEVKTFPDQWKDNVIDINPKVTNIGFHGNYSVGGGTGGAGAGGFSIPSIYSLESEPLYRRAENAWKHILYRCAVHNIDADEVEGVVADLVILNSASHYIFQAMRNHKIDEDDLYRQKPADIEKAILEEMLSQEKEREEAKARIEEAKKDAEKKGAANPKSTTSEGSATAGNVGGTGASAGSTGEHLTGVDEAYESWRYNGGC
jgi:hypothetical protein